MTAWALLADTETTKEMHSGEERGGRGLMMSGS